MVIPSDTHTEGLRIRRSHVQIVPGAPRNQGFRTHSPEPLFRGVGLGVGLFPHGRFRMTCPEKLGPDLPQGAGILRLVLDYDLYEHKGMTPQEIFWNLRGCHGCYDHLMIDALEKTLIEKGGSVSRRLNMRQLAENMILDEHVKTKDGMLLLAKGAELNESNILRLIESTKTFDVIQPVAVLVPI